ncbi:MAG: leucyl/phenylalanyl-tRNA--protein transferase [Gammaproteobacteria bacterium]|nr:leucyl/phenylalanyl-tRNA--protein transferase [Gammaproteobacteria bacterium]
MTRNQGPAPYWIDPDSPEIYFPDVEAALREPDGLLAVGGDLKPERLLYAYRNGIFPWFGPDQPILWWAPDPRLVLFPEQLRISRSLSKTLRKQLFTITFDTAFAQVVHACAAPRPGQAGTWITPEMQAAYRHMHELGHAHSVECWQQGKLVGGLYGIAIGHVFFGESMFTRVTDASKVGFVALVQKLQASGYRLIDCQVHTAHLESLGAMMIPRREFTRLLKRETWQMTDSPWIVTNGDR